MFINVLWFEKKVMKIQMQKWKGNKNSENLQQKILYYEVKKFPHL